MGMTRKERQAAEITATFDEGQLARALVLAAEHLAEFPEDSIVRELAQSAARGLEQRST